MNDMNEILHHTYDSLILDGLDISQRQFSKKYLGKCETYMAYLKSGGHQVSNDALLSLWGQLNTRKHHFQADIQTARTESYREILERRVHLLGSLSQDVFKELENRHITERFRPTHW